MIKSLINNFYSYIIKFKYSILISFIVAFLGHSFIIYNNLLNGDGYYFIDRYGIGLSYNRFLLDIAYYINKYFGYNRPIPYLYITLSIIILLSSTIVLYIVFDINNKIYASIISILFIMSPAIVDTFISSFCALPYSISIFLTIVSVYFFIKQQYIYSGVLLTIGLAIYQAYIPLWITVIYSKLIIDYYKINKKISNIFINLFKAFVVLLFSMMIYTLINIICRHIFNEGISGYRGINSLGVYIYNVKTIIQSLIVAYVTVFVIPFSKNYGLLNMSFVARSIYLLSLLYILYFCVLSYKNDKKFGILLIFLYPFVINLQRIIFYSENSPISDRLTLSLIFIFIFIVILNDNIPNLFLINGGGKK